MNFRERFLVSAVFLCTSFCGVHLKLLSLKLLRQWARFLRQRSISVLLFNSLFFLSPCHSQSSPPLSFEESPSPQLFLPLDDLIPGLPSAESETSSLSETHSGAILLEDYESLPHTHRSLSNNRKEQEIVRLLKELKYCSDAKEAKNLSRQLQRLWSRSGSETVDLLMTWAEQSITESNYGSALDIIDSVISLSPTYAEPWVRRAWIHIQLSDFKLAMIDLSHALKLEPRNYIAFFELGIIMEATDRAHLAIKAYEKALSFYPQMQLVQQRLDILLSEQLGQEI
ncbi:MULTISPECIES: tetratricopeptide repeat protein [unclassified Bartonella]|uniref:tetratricopeptide repeat protein n=1 Tax=unclassified Bartonella TaxID=2645622 RepID=UPI00099AA00D|nr:MULTISPECIES: tetratricopeptide repeat protein [unclassified Bartonella]AQX28422.1 Tetratricopeptide repeat-containing protein [Bartonella sp. JB15]AQX29689.1 Tetratricopeptide repeat-containing protein [Bartonella sp. JB63]